MGFTEKLTRFAVRVAGWILGATKIKIAEQEWYATSNLIKGYAATVVVLEAIKQLRSKK